MNSPGEYSGEDQCQSVCVQVEHAWETLTQSLHAAVTHAGPEARAGERSPSPLQLHRIHALRIGCLAAAAGWSLLVTFLTARLAPFAAREGSRHD